jgi:hypothetical protein
MGLGQENMEAAISAIWAARTEFEETNSKRTEELDTEIQCPRFDTQATKTPIDTGGSPRQLENPDHNEVSVDKEEL